MTTQTTVTLNGREYDYDAVVSLMDDSIREDLHGDGYDIGQEQAFVDAYIVRHLERFGGDFAV